MNSVGIDDSKGKSMIAVMHPFGEVACSPFEAPHTSSELSALTGQLKSPDGETRTVMEATAITIYPSQLPSMNRGFMFL